MTGGSLWDLLSAARSRSERSLLSFNASVTLADLLSGHLVDYPLRFGNLARAIGPASFVKLAAGYVAAFSANLFNHHPAGSYEEYMVKHFGRPAYEMVFEPLAEKVWGNPAQLHSEMARTRVPASGGFEVILKLIGLKKETSETNAEFFYYPRGGFGDWPQALREGIEDRGSRRDLPDPEGGHDRTRGRARGGRGR